MKNLFNLLLLLLGTTVIFSCKDKKDDPMPKTKTELLTQSNWKITEFTVSPALMGETNLFTSMKDCEKDNLSKYNANGITTADEGPTKCEATDPQTLTGNWVWNTDQTIITETSTDDTISYTVTELTETKLKVSYSASGYTFVLTMVHP